MKKCSVLYWRWWARASLKPRGWYNILKNLLSGWKTRFPTCWWVWWTDDYSMLMGDWAAGGFHEWNISISRDNFGLYIVYQKGLLFQARYLTRSKVRWYIYYYSVIFQQRWLTLFVFRVMKGLFMEPTRRTLEAVKWHQSTLRICTAMLGKKVGEGMLWISTQVAWANKAINQPVARRRGSQYSPDHFRESRMTLKIVYADFFM